MSNITVLSRPSAPTSVRSPRGFALYVGLDEAKAAAAGVSLPVLVAALRRTLAELAPEAETHATAALAPAGGRDLDVVRVALQEPSALERQIVASAGRPQDARVVLDFSRKRVSVGGTSIGMTFLEIEMLQYLVVNEGRAVERRELIEAFWGESGEVPAERTIDVHMRRMRLKLGQFEDILRTVRGGGYRFDQHADVEIIPAGAVAA